MLIYARINLPLSYGQDKLNTFFVKLRNTLIVKTHICKYTKNILITQVSVNSYNSILLIDH